MAWLDLLDVVELVGEGASCADWFSKKSRRGCGIVLLVILGIVIVGLVVSFLT